MPLRRSMPTKTNKSAAESLIPTALLLIGQDRLGGAFRELITSKCG